MGTSHILELNRSSRTDWRRIVEDIVRIEKKLFPKHESLAKSFEDELRKRNSGLLYMASSDDGEVIGYAMYSFPTSLSASITKLAVKENHQRRGHGEALLRAAVDKCRTRKVQSVVLHVDPLRTQALNLYEKVGFKVDGLIEGYYSPDRNAYRMILDLEF
ncbi:hypothetical protein MLD38_003090 [Melastoma candidum]|uniref:Uncharacterized protein n=1 Tax=Melastoma candidum TaxID=119954 RepID=A0ACB9S189_9MYRT|nr:hypothetical protein MLD38_003090 [Melastoma candidum]